MVSSRDRNSHPIPSHCLSGRRHTPYKPAHAQAYSHINIQHTPDIREEGFTGLADSTGFIRNSSLQDKIADELAYAKKLHPRSSSDSPPGSRPTTFAEATMSTRVRSGGGRGIGNKPNRFDSSPTGSKPTEALGTLKYTKKKKKVQKWSPLDLSAAEHASEVGNTTSEAGTSRDVSPTSTSLIPHQKQLEENGNSAAFGSDTPIGKSTGVAVQDSYYSFDTDPTPTQARFDSSSLVLYNHASHDFHNFYGATLDPIDINYTDTEETKNKFAAVMAHLNQYVSPTPTSSGEDAFDSLNWDPDLPSVSTPDKSPEPVKAKPQAIAYTTVGSLVNPNIVPQFTAPNRIQREGAGRRPLMTMTNRQYDNLFQNRGPPPPLSMQNSMHYTQQLLQAPTTFEINSQKSRLPLHIDSAMMAQLTEQEKQVLGQVNETIPRQVPSAILGSAVHQASSTQSSSNTSGDTNQSFRLRDLIDEDDLGRSYGSQGLKQGLEKMQTLQRLARFENPMREHALNRLSEFSVANATAQVTSKTNASKISLESMLRNSQSRSTIEARAKYQGELNRCYQFPQTSLTASSTPQINPLFGAYSASTHNSSAPGRPPPGCPQPLTAGPPGQRQSNGFSTFPSARLPTAASSNKGFTNGCLSQARSTAGFAAASNPDFNPEHFLPNFLKYGCLNDSSSNKPTSSFDESIRESESGSRSYYQPEFSTDPTWETRLQTRPRALTRALTAQAVAPTELGPHTSLRNTLSPDSMKKYYPHGLPSGMMGSYIPLTSAEKLRWSDIPSEEETPEQKKEREDKERDDIFYFGQRQYHMSAEQHIEELEQRQPTLVNPFGPIGQRRKTFLPVLKNEITPEDMDKMSVAEAAKQPLDAAFGSFLAYSESSTFSRAKLSGWIISPSRYVDNTAEGNRTMFGEDWGYANPVATSVSSRSGSR